MKYAKIANFKGRILFIGDLHGCFDETVELLDKCQVTSDDTVVFLGDLIDRGPDNDKCVDLVMQIERKQGAAACILGNHEERHLQYRIAEEKGKDPNVRVPTHVATRAQLRPEHYEYFKTLPMYISFPQYNAIAVHAGAWPNIPMQSQSERHMLHIQMINPKPGQNNKIDRNSMWPSKAPADWRFWTNYWTGPEKIIFGHTVIDKPLVTEFAVGIDGGAVFGRELWAYELPSGKIYSVKGQKDYGSGSRGREVNPISHYPIHGDVGCFS